MEEEFIYPSDEELAASFVDDLFNAFMVEIKKYPVLSIEEQKALAIRLRNGDTSVKDILTKHNLRLVVYVASAYKNKIKHLKIMDIIQEGCIGLLKAIDKYEPEKGAFSTYAIYWIRQAITRAIDDTDEEIRKPVHVSFKIRKYRHILNEAERNHTPIPDDDELMAMLECNEETLEIIKKKAFEKVVSTQTKVGDEDDSELGDFIADTKDDFSDVLDNLNDQELLSVIKNKLNPLEYYFLYNYEIDKNSDDATLQGLANEFNVTRERVRQIKKKAYEKSGKYVKDKKLRRIEAARIEKNLGISLSRINLKPYDIDNIVLYQMVKKQLSELDNLILSHILFSEIKLNNQEMAKFFKISKQELDKRMKRINLKVRKCLEDSENFKREKMVTIRMYGTKIFMLVPEDEVKIALASDEVTKKLLIDEGKNTALINEIESQREAVQEEVEKEIQEEIKETKRQEEIKRIDESEKQKDEKYAAYAKMVKDSEEKEKKNVFELVDINDHDMLVIIKQRLSSLEYYIFYQLLKNKNKFDKTIKSMAKSLNLSTFTILAHTNRIIKKLEKFIYDENFFTVSAKRLTDKYNTSLDNFKDEPIDPESLIIMAYVHEELSDIENKVLKLSILGPTKNIFAEDLEILGLSSDEYQELLDILKMKIDALLLDVDKFNKFKKHMIKTHGIKIFNESFDNEYNKIDYEALKKKYDMLSFEEIKELYGDNWDKLDTKSQNLLKRYFTVPSNSFTSNDEWENAFYLELNNISLKDKENHLNPKMLYDCYLENKDYFSEKAQMLLECFVFETREREEYKWDVSRQYINSIRSVLLDKLEKIYFNVHNILYSFSFTKEQWERVLEKHEDKFDENKIIAMNMFYGIDGEAMSIPEIAEVFGVERDKMHDYLAKTRKTAMALYINRSCLRDVDEDIYIPYALNKAYPFTDLNREILLMYLIQELSYAEIKEELKKRKIELSQYQISNIVTDSLRKIDGYRFGLVKVDSYSKKFIEDFIKSNKKFTARDKEFIREKFLKHYDNDLLALKFNMNKEEVNKQVQRFTTSMDNFKVIDCILTEEDYLKEFKAYPLERVVDEKQMHMLSYYYGVKCEYNPDGIVLSVPEMIKTLPEYEAENLGGLSRKIKKANDLIKRKKKNQYHNDLIFMPTDELIKIMGDPHLPISDKEKHIICSIYGIRRYKQKTLQELSEFYGEGVGSIRRRYQRAFISIFKYQNGEIPAKIDYDYDILPLMRYFSKYDRKLIEDSYKKGLSFEKIAKKYKLTFNQVVTRFNRLNLEIFEMINYPKKEYFDFDFFEKAVKDPLLPFYGNLDEAVKIFDLHFANNQVKNMSGREIVDELNLARDEESVNKTIYQLILAVCRYKKGMRKEHSYTFEDVKDYYMRHKDEMPAYREKIYLTYFKRHLKENAHRNREYINKIILKDIIKERNPEFNEIEELTYDEVVELINHNHFSSKVLNSLLNKIGETERLIMSGQELNHVYRLLNRLDKSVTLDNKQRLAKTQ